MSESWIKRLMFATDIGFVVYWIAIATALIPPFAEPVLVHWNWSFVVLDLFASASGLAALWLLRTGRPQGRAAMMISLALTHAAGLMALSFYVLRSDYQLAWWLPNLWLTVFPLVAIASLLRPRVAAG